jgi:carboxynorspermidine decarboxylase
VFLIEKPEAGDQKPEDRVPAVTLQGETYDLAGDPSSHSASNIQNPKFTCRLGGPTCLAGDVIGDFSFPRELKAGDMLVFDDMAHYTMVKTTMFNGVKHPPIALQHEDGRIEIIREFRYEDFRDRLC